MRLWNGEVPLSGFVLSSFGIAQVAWIIGIDEDKVDTVTQFFPLPSFSWKGSLVGEQ
jgi:hypothetical protein